MFSSPYEQSTLERNFLKIHNAIVTIIGEPCKILEIDNDFESPSLRFDFPDGHHVQAVIPNIINEQEFDKMLVRVKQVREEYLKNNESNP